MKNILIFISLLAFAGAYGQQEIYQQGAFKFQYLRIDSSIALPGGNTAKRPTPVAGKYWIRFNTDSAKFEYSTGSIWNSFNGGSASIPTAWGAITGTLTSQADLAAALNLKLKIADTSAMLTPYLRVNTANASFVSLSGSYSNPSWIASLAWNKLTAVPSTFTPSAHTHSLSDLTQSTASNNQIVQWNGTAWIPITATKALVGLSNVDNTSDVNKPVSTAQQAAIDLKLSKTDTAAMLAAYLKSNDAASIYAMIVPKDTVIITGEGAPNNYYRDTSISTTCSYVVITSYDKIYLPAFIGKRIRVVAGGITLPENDCWNSWYFLWDKSTGILRVTWGTPLSGGGAQIYTIQAY